MADFFVAGADTTSSTLRWTVLYLIHYPDMQSKIREEIERVVGKSRHVTIGDREKLVSL